MSILKSILGAFGGKSKLVAKSLTERVKKKSNTGLGAFVDLNNDLGLMVDALPSNDPAILMPYYYARRVVNGGMFAQGAIDKAEFDRVNALFFGIMVQIGSGLTQSEQVKFQEESLDRALELLFKYLFGATRQSTTLLVNAAIEGVSLRDALVGGLDQGQDNLKEVVEPAMCYDWVMKHEYCMAFFAAGWWEPGDDIETTSEKLLKYFKSVNISFEAQAVEPDEEVYAMPTDEKLMNKCNSGSDISGPENRITNIAEAFNRLTEESMGYIGKTLSPQQAVDLIEMHLEFFPEIFSSCSNDVVAVAIMMKLSENAIHHKEVNSVCMLCTAALLASRNLIEEEDLPDHEAAYVSNLQSSAFSMLKENYRQVDVVIARNWISVIMLTFAPIPSE